jgi:hypothetical protein
MYHTVLQRLSFEINNKKFIFEPRADMWSVFTANFFTLQVGDDLVQTPQLSQTIVSSKANIFEWIHVYVSIRKVVFSFLLC